jgi:short-subunit dehydrogenase
METLVLAYGDEVRNTSAIRVAIVNPGPTRTVMRARAYPGEDPATLKEPSAVGEAILALLAEDFEPGHRLELSR